jgi:phosphoglycolate phosphatase
VPRRKPDAAHLNAVLARIDVAASDAVLIGDSDTDAATARNAGVRFIAVTYGYGPLADESRIHAVDQFSALSAALGFR